MSKWVTIESCRDQDKLEFDINPDLELHETQALEALLMEFSDCFASNPKKTTVTHVGEHVIETVPGARPIKSKRYRMLPQQEQEVEKQTERMIRDGIAHLSTSPWASNVLLVKKKDGTTRFVIDYRQLNDVTVKDSYPMPNVREIIDKMKGSKYFSKINMASAYWAVPIREEDRQKTAFMTPRKLMEMCVTAYGQCNSQATYQRIMDKTLNGIEGAERFVDDVCEFSPTFKVMLEVIKAVLQRFRKAQLQMHIDKCKFGYQEVDFVGHHISGNGVAPIADNVKAILDFPEPTNLSELERFIGMANY